MMRSRHSKLVRTIAFAGVPLLAAAAIFGACNYHWYPYGTSYQFNKMEFVSAYPAVKKTVDGADRWVRVCGNDVEPTGVLLALNLLGTQPDKSPDTSVQDNDVSMRPGDVVKSAGQSATQHRFVLEENWTITEDNFKVTLDCLEPYPDVDLTGNMLCNPDYGVQNPGAVQKIAPDKIRYNGLVAADQDGFYRRTFAQDNAVGVAILVDQSGSMKGFVEKDSKVEVSPSMSPVPWDGLNFAKNASDRNNQRLSAVQYLMSSLNAREKAIVFQFGEKIGAVPTVVCYNPGGDPEEILRAECFGTNRALVTGCDGTADCGGAVIDSELDKLQSSARGRTPLWSAAADVYDFLKKTEMAKNPADQTKVLHIITVTDGPDTCAADSPDYKAQIHYKDKDGKDHVVDQGLCGGTGYAALAAAVQTDLDDPTVPRIHFDFVQFQSPGYLERDPRQQELACVTGGQYLFINSQDIGSDDQALETVLKEAVLKIRYTLSGAWEMGLNLPDIQSAKLPKGAEIAIGGTITLLGKEESITLNDKITSLRVGDSDPENPVDLPKFDTRGAIRLPCAAGDSCAWYPIWKLDNLNSPAFYNAMLTGCDDFACVDTSLVCGAKPKADNTVCSAPLPTGGAAVPGICCAQGCWGGGVDGGCKP